MTLIIDTKNISLETQNLDNYIKEYDDNIYDIFFELNKLNNYWKGQEFDSFEKNVSAQKFNNQLILENLHKYSALYKKVDTIYTQKKIEFDVQNKDNIMNQINNCICDLGDINNIIYNTIVPNDFEFTADIVDIKDNLIKNKEKLNDYKIKFNIETNNINQKELELLSEINKIEDIMIEKF